MLDLWVMEDVFAQRRRAALLAGLHRRGKYDLIPGFCTAYLNIEKHPRGPGRPHEILYHLALTWQHPNGTIEYHNYDRPIHADAIDAERHMVQWFRHRFLVVLRRYLADRIYAAVMNNHRMEVVPNGPLLLGDLYDIALDAMETVMEVAERLTHF